MVRKTSIDAYNKIVESGLVSKRRMEVYDVLFHKGPLTRSEIDAILQEREKGKPLPYRSHISSRLFELRGMNLVKEIGEKICKVTNMKVILWDVTDNLPSKLEKKKSNKQIIKELQERIKQLEELLAIKK